MTKLTSPFRPCNGGSSLTSALSWVSYSVVGPAPNTRRIPWIPLLRINRLVSRMRVDPPLSRLDVRSRMGPYLLLVGDRTSSPRPVEHLLSLAAAASKACSVLETVTCPHAVQVKEAWSCQGKKSGDTILKSPAHEIAGCPHLPGIGICHGNQASSQQGSDLVGVDPVVLALAAVEIPCEIPGQKFRRNSGDIMLFSKNSIVSAEFCMMTPSPSRMQTYIQLVCRSIPQYNLCWMV